MKSTYYFMSIALFCLMACNDDPITNDQLPECMSAITDEFPQLTIQSQKVENVYHYWLNTGANAVDGDEYIISESCDTVCFYGGWINPDCIEDYSADGWIIVWP